MKIRRSLLVIGGAAGLLWALYVFPVFRAEGVYANVGAAVLAGERFKPEVLRTITEHADSKGSILRSSSLSSIAAIKLRQIENAMRGAEGDFITDEKLGALAHAIDLALQNAPDDSFLWLARFWLSVTRDGLNVDNLRSLRESYELGPYEGWIAIKRNRLALAAYEVLPPDLAERAVTEFVGLVRWGLVSQAATIAAATPAPVREILFRRLDPLSYEQRRIFAAEFYGYELDDVLVPGIPPPVPNIPPPILPPDF